MTRREDPIWGTEPSRVARQRRLDARHERGAADAAVQRRDLARVSRTTRCENARQDDMKISVFTGPFLDDDDPTMFGVQIPVEFWKVIAFVHDETGELCATGYTMSQRDFLSEDEFVFGAHETAQRSIALDRAASRALVRAARGTRPVRGHRRGRAGTDRRAADQIPQAVVARRDAECPRGPAIAGRTRGAGVAWIPCLMIFPRLAEHRRRAARVRPRAARRQGRDPRQPAGRAAGRARPVAGHRRFRIHRAAAAGTRADRRPRRGAARRARPGQDPAAAHDRQPARRVDPGDRRLRARRAPLRPDHPGVAPPRRRAGRRAAGGLAAPRRALHREAGHPGHRGRPT